jgi:primary-amine oxidase
MLYSGKGGDHVRNSEKTNIELKQIQHPLDPLSVAEIESVVSILQSERQLDTQHRFVTVMLNEPHKEVVLAFKKGDSIEREAFAIILDNTDGLTYEAVISLTQAKVVSWTLIPDVQPSVMPDEFMECEEIVKADTEFRKALDRRGITNYDLVMVDPWSAGNFGFAEEKGKRLLRAMSWIKSHKTDNGYAHPIEGIIVFVDMNKKQVVKVEDYGVVPIPPHHGNYQNDHVKARDGIKPLEIIQSEGPSFEVEGHEIIWQKWHIRFGFNPREGLVLHTVSYDDKGRLRPILYRASLSEMVVPYGDPTNHHNRQNAFDVGEYGIGMLANSLKLGCDCVGEIRYFDAFMTDSRGNIVTIPNAICLHEEDFGILWKHTDWRTDHVEVRRSRRLVLSSISTVGNYEYGFFWYFYQDGTISFEVKLTGILFTAAIETNEKPKFGSLIAPQLNAPNHQHFFNVRMDLCIDGMDNSIYEVHTEAEPIGPNNPFGNAFYTKSTLLEREWEAKQTIDLASAKYWKIGNPSVQNQVGEPVGYKLVTGENALPFAHPESSLIKRAGFITNHLWVTPYDKTEKYAAGNYPNQHAGGDGLPDYTSKNRQIDNRDIVVWYTMGHHHIPRPEDWPVMPTSYIGFSLKPVGFFDRNPALDVPPAEHKLSHCNKKSC